MIKMAAEWLILISVCIVLSGAAVLASSHFEKMHDELQLNTVACKDKHSRPVCWYKSHFQQ